MSFLVFVTGITFSGAGCSVVVFISRVFCCLCLYLRGLFVLNTLKLNKYNIIYLHRCMYIYIYVCIYIIYICVCVRKVK